MSEFPKPEHKNENSQSPRRNQQFRPQNRQRPNPGVSKAIHYFGVPDLRDLLNQKHQNEHAQAQTQQQPRGRGPPPDPSYGFLKDPEREQYEERSPRGPKQYFHEKPSNVERPHQRNDNKRPHQQRIPKATSSDATNNTYDNIPGDQNLTQHSQQRAQPSLHSPRGNTRGRRPARPQTNEVSRQIENPVNIKVEVSTNTGQRSCTIDEGTTLPNIKHVPDRPDHEKRQPNNFRGRGRPRGRGGSRGYGNRRFAGQPRPGKSQSQLENEENKEETVDEKLSQLQIQDESFEDDIGGEYSEVHDEFQDSVESIQENVTVTASSENNETKRSVHFSSNENVEKEGDPSNSEEIENNEEQGPVENKN